MKISLLARPSLSTAVLLNWLIREGYSDLELILEAPLKRSLQLRNRARRLGWLRAFGQGLFMALIVPSLNRQVASRMECLLSEQGLDGHMPALETTLAVENINDPIVAERLKQSSPKIILVNGTRIIGPQVLKATSSPFINTHAGITPDYRGVHGGYWALWNDEPEKFGVTLHLVDEGVDTGAILAQVVARPTDDDNFASYPLVQQMAAFEELKGVLRMIERGEPVVPLVSRPGRSKQWVHPTLLQYIRGRLRGVR